MTDYRIREMEWRRGEMRRIAALPANRRWKWIALSLAGCAILLMVVMIVWIDKLSDTAMLVMQGCTGVLAIGFVIAAGVFVYRVNCELMRARRRR